MSSLFGHRHDIGISLLGGFSASFLAFSLTTMTGHFGALQGQLIAGDPAMNRELPTTFNEMHAALAGENPMVNAMSNYSWWVAVMLGGIVAAFIIFKLMRRYV